jgi:hypothetical protein
VRRYACGVLFAGALAGITPREGRCDDLRAAAALVADAWRAEGAVVVREDARFLHEGEAATLRLPLGAGELCQTLALIGARGLSFHARIGNGASDEAADEQVASAAGVLEMTSCGTDPIRLLRVTSDAGRGALETVSARSPQPLTALRAILLERTGGVLPAPPEPGALPPLPTPSRRAAVAEARAARDGARLAPRREWRSGADGKGEERIALEAGCHRVELFAPDPPAMPGSRHPRLDLDAAMKDETGELIARDRTSAPDARVETCVGEGTNVAVLFEGATPGSPVLVTHATFALPEHLPLVWGQRARARMAAALLPRHIGAFDRDAVFLAQGASGLTPVPFEVEPGACYVAVAALERGHARGVGLRVAMGARSSSDERGTSDDSSAVAFCARDRENVRFEVDARGAGVAWGLAAFRVAGGVWEASR